MRSRQEKNIEKAQKTTTDDEERVKPLPLSAAFSLRSYSRSQSNSSETLTSTNSTSISPKTSKRPKRSTPTSLLSFMLPSSVPGAILRTQGYHQSSIEKQTRWRRPRNRKQQTNAPHHCLHLRQLRNREAPPFGQSRGQQTQSPQPNAAHFYSLPLGRRAQQFLKQKNMFFDCWVTDKAWGGRRLDHRQKKRVLSASLLLQFEDENEQIAALTKLLNS